MQYSALFAHFHTGCSLLLITALNSCVNKTCWQHVTACDIKAVYIKTWFMCGSQDSSIRLLQVHSSTLRCLWAASEATHLQEGHWLLRMSGSECKAEDWNLRALMRPYSFCSWSSSPGKVENVSVHVGGKTQREKTKVCELECVSMCVSVCACGEGMEWGWGYFYSCYILWRWRADNVANPALLTTTSVKLRFLKPVPWALQDSYKISFWLFSFKTDDTKVPYRSLKH